MRNRLRHVSNALPLLEGHLEQIEPRIRSLISANHLEFDRSTVQRPGGARPSRTAPPKPRGATRPRRCSTSRGGVMGVTNQEEREVTNREERGMMAHDSDIRRGSF
jgi:hypothetical protein